MPDLARPARRGRTRWIGLSVSVEPLPILDRRFAVRLGNLPQENHHMRGRPIFVALTTACLLTGCSAPYHLDPDDIDEGTFERWVCGDFVHGWGSADAQSS